jgi:hypothetical protein
MPKYKVTIVDHVVYDCFIKAESEEAAREAARDLICDSYVDLLNRVDNAGWLEVGDIELV